MAYDDELRQAKNILKCMAVANRRHAENKRALTPNTQTVMDGLRAQLLAAGFLAPRHPRMARQPSHWLFYRPAAELTAFAVNLRGYEDRVEIAYGFASTAFTRFKGDENALLDYGVDDADVNLREYAVLRHGEDPMPVRAAIQALYDAHASTDKDNLLKQAKAKRAVFFRRITEYLKPYGFKKHKTNSWVRPLEPGYALIVDFQKSSYADQYTIRVGVGCEESIPRFTCWSCEARTHLDPLDWQRPQDELDQELTRILDDILVPLIQMPLSELGKTPEIWDRCHCDRKHCESCWIEKNVWDVQGFRDTERLRRVSELLQSLIKNQA